jgi:hypothetical protein
LKDFSGLNRRPDKGELLESFVFHEMQKQLEISQEIYYWRTREKEEVDFVVVRDRIPVPVEVKSKMTDTSIPMGIRQFLHKYPESKIAVVLNEDLFKKETYKNKKVLFLPHYHAKFIPAL